jgi:hypothetical protein
VNSVQTLEYAFMESRLKQKIAKDRRQAAILHDNLLLAEKVLCLKFGVFMRKVSLTVTCDSFV